MAVIGNLSISLTAKTKDFTKKLNKVTGSITKTAKRIGALGAAFGAAAVAGIAFYVKKAFGAIDATAKLADTIGLTTEQLVGYQKAAAISGATTQDINTAFRRMLKNVSDAGLGLTTAQRAFEALNLNADELKGLSTDQMFKRIADQINKIPAAADRARVAQDLFGRSGLSILKITEQGAAGIAAFQREVLKTGEAFSRIDAAKVEAANDAINRAGGVLQGVINKLAIKLAPFIEAAATKFKELAMSSSVFGSVVGNVFMTTVDWLKVSSTALTRFMQGLNLLGAIASGAGLAIVGLRNQIGLSVMQIGAIWWNTTKAIGQAMKTAGSLIKLEWKGIEVAFFSFIELAGTAFSGFLNNIALGVDRLAPGISKALLDTADNILGAVQANSKLATDEFGSALDDLKKNAADTKSAFTGIFDGIPRKGPLHDQMVGLAERTGDLIQNIETLEKDNSNFIGGIDQTIGDIEGRARKTAAAIKGLTGSSNIGDDPIKSAEQRRQSDFKQVSLSRFVLNSSAGSTVKKQKVEAPEFKQMVSLLRDIASSDGGAVAQ